jgi:hypothetical protein
MVQPAHDAGTGKDIGTPDERACLPIRRGADSAGVAETAKALKPGFLQGLYQPQA